MIKWNKQKGDDFYMISHCKRFEVFALYHGKTTVQGYQLIDNKNNKSYKTTLGLKHIKAIANTL